MEQMDTDEDIKQFLKESLTGISEDTWMMLENVRPTVLHEITNRVEGLFIYASILLQILIPVMRDSSQHLVALTDYILRGYSPLSGSEWIAEQIDFSKLYDYYYAVLDKSLTSMTQYACLHWAGHLSAAAETSEDQQVLMKRFCEKSLLVWPEALSILNKLDSAKEALELACSWCKKAQNEPLKIILDDARYILLNNFSLIDTFPNELHHHIPQNNPSSPLFQAQSHISHQS
ncbi:hypothetical protein WOLCODRAFT_21354 [Wolfiporia cocos MD-104 SS10]|uniref:Uncharacterized protein n=1 Tax=Wolfiporia cocos (strain MD-104) TaxID=742152 RepID=A0A2H3JA39_WOLCO|nr:hypothetical protein WOLCODRAFT_21354 [Wolfiporia cocos MD-104 SS10]